MDYTVHGILQAIVLGWVAFPFSRRSSQPRDPTQVSCIAGRFFTVWAVSKDGKAVIDGIQDTLPPKTIPIENFKLKKSENIAETRMSL